MNKQIHFTKTTSFLGKNGCFKSIGLSIFKVGDVVQIYPVTSKDRLGKCNICIPESSVPELIDTLRLFLEGGSDTAPDPKSGNIARINEIIKEWGATSSSELQLESSPCKLSIDNGKQNVSELIENFYVGGVSTVTYCNEEEIADNDYIYEELSDDLIDEILNIMEDYDTDMQKTEKKMPIMNKAYFVTEITVIDPDSKGEVEVAMYKHENGGMFGVDSSFLDQIARTDGFDRPIIPDPFTDSDVDEGVIGHVVLFD